MTQETLQSIENLIDLAKKQNDPLTIITLKTLVLAEQSGKSIEFGVIILRFNVESMISDIKELQRINEIETANNN